MPGPKPALDTGMAGMTGMTGNAAALKVYEADRYYAALLAPRQGRDDLLALVVFAAELRRVAAEVSEPMIGEIRLQWWADAIHDARSGSKTGNPVADDFAVVARAHELPNDVIDGIIGAARSQIYGNAPEKPEDLVPALIAFEGGLFRLWGMIAGAADQRNLAHVARPAAIAYGVARRLYGPLQRRQARFQPVATEAWERDLHKEAQLQLDAARVGVAGLTGASKTLFLPLALVEPYLRSWNLNLDAGARSHERARLSQLQRMWLIWRSHMTGRI